MNSRLLSDAETTTNNWVINLSKPRFAPVPWDTTTNQPNATSLPVAFRDQLASVKAGGCPGGTEQKTLNHAPGAPSRQDRTLIPNLSGPTLNFSFAPLCSEGKKKKKRGKKASRDKLSGVASIILSFQHQRPLDTLLSIQKVQAFFWK